MVAGDEAGEDDTSSSSSSSSDEEKSVGLVFTNFTASLWDTQPVAREDTRMHVHGAVRLGP